MSVEIPDLAIGTHEVKVRLRDASGNDLTTEGTAAFELTDDAFKFRHRLFE